MRFSRRWPCASERQQPARRREAGHFATLVVTPEHTARMRVERVFRNAGSTACASDQGSWQSAQLAVWRVPCGEGQGDNRRAAPLGSVIGAARHVQRTPERCFAAKRRRPPDRRTRHRAFSFCRRPAPAFQGAGRRAPHTPRGQRTARTPPLPSVRSRFRVPPGDASRTCFDDGQL